MPERKHKTWSLFKHWKRKGITFVLPTYNAAALLHDTLDSLVRQKWNKYQIFIVDDASTDSTKDLIKFYQQKYCPFDYRDVLNETFEGISIRVHWNKERRGAAWCRNYANQRAFYEIISVCDAGDIYHEEKAADACKALTTNRPNLDVWSHAVITMDARKKEKRIQYSSPFEGLAGQKPSISHPTVCYRKDVARAIKYREESLETDQFERFLIEAAQHGFRFGYSDKVLAYKLDTPEYRHSRNLMEAYKFKRKTYEDYGIEIPEFLEQAESQQMVIA